jgi:hypothetical protein
MSSSKVTRYVTVALTCGLAVACSDQDPLSPDETTAAQFSTFAASRGSQPANTGVVHGGWMSSRKILEEYVYSGFAMPGGGIEFLVPEGGGTWGHVEFHGAVDVELDLGSPSTGIPYTAVVDATLYYLITRPGEMPEPATHRMEITLTNRINVNAVPDYIRSAAEFREWLIGELTPINERTFYFPALFYRVGEDGLPVQVWP